MRPVTEAVNVLAQGSEGGAEQRPLRRPAYSDTGNRFMTHGKVDSKTKIQQSQLRAQEPAEKRLQFALAKER
jgi:hypothetical protein